MLTVDLDTLSGIINNQDKARRFLDSFGGQTLPPIPQSTFESVVKKAGFTEEEAKAFAEFQSGQALKLIGEGRDISRAVTKEQDAPPPPSPMHLWYKKYRKLRVDPDTGRFWNYSNNADDPNLEPKPGLEVYQEIDSLLREGIDEGYITQDMRNSMKYWMFPQFTWKDSDAPILQPPSKVRPGDPGDIVISKYGFDSRGAWAKAWENYDKYLQVGVLDQELASTKEYIRIKYDLLEDMYVVEDSLESPGYSRVTGKIRNTAWPSPEIEFKTFDEVIDHIENVSGITFNRNED